MSITRITKDGAEHKDLPLGGILNEFPSIGGVLKIATAIVKSRIPETKSLVACNEECTETFVIIDGQAKFYCNQREVEVETGDIVVIEPKTEFAYETKGMEVVIITTPPWTSEQYKILKPTVK